MTHFKIVFTNWVCRTTECNEIFSIVTLRATIMHLNKKNYGQLCMKPAYCDSGAVARRGISDCLPSICFELW